MIELIFFLIIGGIAGWIASTMMKGHGMGLLANIVIGIIGAVIGGYVLGLFGIDLGGLIGSLVTAVIGAVILLFIVGLFRSNTARPV
ncbi:MAG: GlsB/YeaQ/YmgE family stress response membrane protein [Candidatus Andersenbacteria bacterium]